MSGHSKWSSIKHKKGALDAKRGKIFTKHAKMITLAARDGGADPDMNSALRLAIDNAKADNTPNNNIERAIKRGTGDLKDAAEIVEIMYEGYGPVGTALMIQCLSDNKNRTVSNVKSTLAKNGGNMGTSGSVAYMFQRKGMIIVKLGDKDRDEAELALIDTGAEDIQGEGDTLEVQTDAADLAKVRENIVNLGFEVASAEIAYIPDNTVKIDEVDKAKKVLKLMDALDEDEDVSNVFSNFDIPDEIFNSLS
ncbi:YebC/PmpR family DNA-binding transcriptional regulator [Patescibacteria group bacterium]|nr:YebC/PmpR family DNA-binding transcriptional regulator [Patescibacteria group bacterium]